MKSIADLIVRPVNSSAKTEKGLRAYAGKGGEFETIGGYSVGDKITLDPELLTVFPLIDVAYGPGSPAEMKHFAF